MSGSIEAQVRFLEGDTDALFGLELHLPENCQILESLIGKLMPVGVQILQLKVKRDSNRIRHRIWIAHTDGQSIRPPQRQVVQSALFELLDDIVTRMRQAPISDQLSVATVGAA